MLFVENFFNGDCCVCGLLVFLCGLEGVFKFNDLKGIDDVVKWMMLFYGIIFSIGGILLFYLSDEVGKFNDYSYWFDDIKKYDDRWVNWIVVICVDMELVLGNMLFVNFIEIVSFCVFNGLCKMIVIRK